MGNCMPLIFKFMYFNMVNSENLQKRSHWIKRLKKTYEFISEVYPITTKNEWTFFYKGNPYDGGNCMVWIILPSDLDAVFLQYRKSEGYSEDEKEREIKECGFFYYKTSEITLNELVNKAHGYLNLQETVL